jgi:heptosyltransferase-1
MAAARILIVKTSSMGDVVHALPLASDIAQARPGAQIEWVVEESFAAIARLHPAVARVIPVAVRRWRETLASGAAWRELRAAIAAIRAHDYDAVIDCQGLLKSALVARAARGPRFGYDRASAREPLAASLYTRTFNVDRALHAIERNRRLGAAALGYALGGPPRFGLCPTAPVGEWATLAGQPFAAMLTNASRATKRWPDERWIAVEHRLAARGLKSLLFWGSEAERADTQRRAQPMRNAIVVPRAALDEIAGVLARASIVIGLDTGLTHLAAAVGRPTIGIYCDYDPKLVGITGDAPCVSVGGADRAPSAHEVIAAADSMLGASESVR